MEELKKVLERLGTQLPKPQPSSKPTTQLDSRGRPEGSCPRCTGTQWLASELKQVMSGKMDQELYPCPRCNPPAPIGQGRTFAGFEAVLGTVELVEAAMEFARVDGSRWLTIVGQNGVGKTHILEAIGTEMRRAGQHPQYVFLPDFLDRLRSSYNPDSDSVYEDLWQMWADAEILLLDDLSDTAKPTPWAIGQVERIVDGRYRHGAPYVITTNGNLERIAVTWGRRLADRVFDTRSGAVRVIYTHAASYRTGQMWK